MTVYAKQNDYNANIGKDPNIQLYDPNKTVLGKGDVFLGGTAVLGDNQLNGAQRIAGMTAQDTANAYSNYLGAQKTIQQTQPDIQAQINSLKQAQINASVAALGKSRDSALSNLSAEKATIAPQYYAKRNAESTQNQLASKNFAEYMAQRGGANSGVANQAEIASNVALQGNLGALNQQEQAANNDNARRVTDVQNGYASDVATAQAGAEATALQNTINELNTQRQLAIQADQFNKTFGLQQAGVTGTYGGSPTLAALTRQQQNALNTAQLTGSLNGQSTLPYLQYQSGLDQFNKNYELQKAQQQADETYRAQQLALQQQQAAASQAKANNSGPSVSELNYQNKQTSDAAYARAMQGINAMADSHKSRSEILDWIRSNASDLQANGVPVQDLYNWADKTYRWDKNGDSWYNIDGN